MVRFSRAHAAAAASSPHIRRPIGVFPRRLAGLASLEGGKRLHLGGSVALPGFS
jgi:hypothetical protein